MNYLDQSVNSIRLFLVTGDPQIEQFTLLGQNSFTWNESTVTFGILGESHYITIETRDDVFTEICACTSATFDPSRSTTLHSEHLSQIPQLPLTKETSTYSYSFNYRFADYRRGTEFLSNLREVKAKGETHFLQYLFPGRFFFSDKPVTEIFIRTNGNSLYIRTVHTYPNDKQVALTESVIRKKS